MARINTVTLPPQRLAYSKKTKKWRKDNLDYADTHSFYHNETVRKSLKNRVINLNLYNGLVDVRDMSTTVNPFHLDASFTPENIPHNPILVPKLDLLVGEESKRRFDWSVLVTNSNAISKKEEDKKNLLFQKLSEYLQANYSDDELKQKMDELESHMKYEWQDIRERMGNQILRHYWNEQDFQTTLLQGFKDALIFAEEIYQIDLVHSEPVLSKLNPLKVRTVRSGNSDKIEDSSIIIVEDHWAPGKIVDYFHDELKEKDIDYIMDYSTHHRKGEYSDDQNNHTLLRDKLVGIGDSVENIFNLAEINGHYFGSDYTDENGNIRVLRVYWKSLKKIQKVKYYDEEGEVQYKIRSEEYIPNKELGEESKNMWVNEWWEGTKIGKDIYVQMKPRPIQFNRLNNPSYCHPGIIGQIYNTNQGKAVSLVDRCKNYQYMYDAVWDRLNKAISTNYGKIFELDLAKVPDNWEIDKWLHFAIVNKIAVIDSFKEGTQGAATGKLAGGMNTQGGRAIDMETGSYIQQHIQLLEFIKMEMGEIAGVTKQREGAIHQNETASGVERSVNQSSHITEYWFHMHEKVKLRVLSAFLETAKVALRGKNKKVQYILDDQTIEMLNMDDEVINDVDFGVVAISSYKTQELEQSLKSYAQAHLQNGGSLATIMDIYFSPSLSDMRRKIETAEDKLHERNSQSQQEANKIAQQAQADAKELKLMEMQQKEAESIREDNTKRYVADLNAQNGDNDGDGIKDEYDAEKTDIERQKMLDNKLLSIRKLDDAMKMHDDKMAKEDKKIAASKVKSKNSK